MNYINVNFIELLLMIRYKQGEKEKRWNEICQLKEINNPLFMEFEKDWHHTIKKDKFVKCVALITY